jgi:GntR family transcriptional regulator, transcriptional repressor for pyruvate dehydrogenase complex
MQSTAKQPRKLAHAVVERLSGRIRRGEFKPGDKLPTEYEITRAFGVSRTVVREAMSRLQAAELVETRHGIGTFVRPGADRAPFRIDPVETVTLNELIAILELRMSLEAEAAALAAERRSAAHLAAMRRALDTFAKQVAQSKDAVQADFRFHLTIAQATANRHFADLIRYLGTMLFPRTRVNSAQLAGQKRAAYLERVNREHEKIYEAIERCAPEAARAAMRSHLENSRERLRRAYRALLNA